MLLRFRIYFTVAGSQSSPDSNPLLIRLLQMEIAAGDSRQSWRITWRQRPIPSVSLLARISIRASERSALRYIFEIDMISIDNKFKLSGKFNSNIMDLKMESVNSVNIKTPEVAQQVEYVELTSVVNGVAKFTLHLIGNSEFESERSISEFVEWYGTSWSKGGGCYPSVKFIVDTFMLDGHCLNERPDMAKSWLCQFAMFAGKKDPCFGRESWSNTADNPVLVHLTGIPGIEGRLKDVRLTEWTFRAGSYLFKGDQSVAAFPCSLEAGPLFKDFADKCKLIEVWGQSRAIQLGACGERIWYLLKPIASIDSPPPSLMDVLLRALGVSTLQKVKSGLVEGRQNLRLHDIVDQDECSVLKFNKEGSDVEVRIEGDRYSDFKRAMSQGRPFLLQLDNLTIALTKEDLDNCRLWKQEDLDECQAQRQKEAERRRFKIRAAGLLLVFGAGLGALAFAGFTYCGTAPMQSLLNNGRLAKLFRG
jgi:hypothetical protein